MALHPAPTIANHLGLIVQPLSHSSIGRTAIVTAAVNDTAGADAQSIVNDWQAAFNAELAPFFDTNVTVEKAFVRLGDGSSSPTEATAAGSTVTGTITNDMPPPQVATLLSKRTGFAGKKNRGRMYLPWAMDDLNINEAGGIDGTVLASLQTNCDAFLAALAGSSTPMCIANKTTAVDPGTGKRYVTAWLLGHTVTALIAEHTVATQRRRLVRS